MKYLVVLLFVTDPFKFEKEVFSGIVTSTLHRKTGV